MEFLEIVLQEAQICDVPLLFVLDHFSSFCHQSKQTLLYTLLDMCSNKRVQMCVIGVDSDCTLTERLEKRVQSRFSQKQIIVPYPSVSDLIQFMSLTLSLPDRDASTRKWNNAIKKVFQKKEFVSLITSQSSLLPLSYHIHFSFREISFIRKRCPEDSSLRRFAAPRNMQRADDRFLERLLPRGASS